MTEWEIIAPIANRAAEAVKSEAVDYIQGGLLFCGKCNTPKEMRLPLQEGEITVRVLCKCSAKKRDEQERQEAVKKFAEMKAEWMKGFSQMTFAADTGTKATALARGIVKRWDEISNDGEGFALYGGTGSGKTYAAACIANELISQGKRAWMATASSIVDQFMTCPEVIESRLRYFDLVVIDDVGAQRDTGYATQRIFDALNMRVQSGKPLIVTTNLDLSVTPDDIQLKRIFSRILGACVPFRIAGDDMRLNNVNRRRKELLEILTRESQ